MLKRFKFSELIGKKIISVEESSCNVVHIICDDESQYSLSAEEQVCDIHGPILEDEWHSIEEISEIRWSNSSEELAIHLLSNNPFVRNYAEFKLKQTKGE